ncbi:MAG: ABC transporter ATP-binding protein [Planctomycetota bacterium]
MDQDSHLVELKKVTKQYRDGHVTALNNVDLVIGRGEFVSIVGASGSGKSTLLNMIGALDRPTSGEVWYNGQQLLHSRQLDELRRSEVGFVFQSFYLLPNLTAIENVQIPMFGTGRDRRQRFAEARDLLARVGLVDRSNHLPRQLSNGQKQRVAVARALANHPSLLLADEPTGALDSRAGTEVVDLLGELCGAPENVTLVLVTHDERQAARADRSIRLQDGAVVGD